MADIDALQAKLNRAVYARAQRFAQENYLAKDGIWKIINKKRWQSVGFSGTPSGGAAYPLKAAALATLLDPGSGSYPPIQTLARTIPAGWWNDCIRELAGDLDFLWDTHFHQDDILLDRYWDRGEATNAPGHQKQSPQPGEPLANYITVEWVVWWFDSFKNQQGLVDEVLRRRTEDRPDRFVYIVTHAEHDWCKVGFGTDARVRTWERLGWVVANQEAAGDRWAAASWEAGIFRELSARGWRNMASAARRELPDGYTEVYPLEALADAQAALVANRPVHPKGLL